MIDILDEIRGTAEKATSEISRIREINERLTNKRDMFSQKLVWIRQIIEDVASRSGGTGCTIRDLITDGELEQIYTITKRDVP